MIFGRFTDVGIAYHGVLSHKNNTLRLTIPSQTLSNLVHLLRTDIVDGDNEYGFMGFQQALKLVEVGRLVTSLAPHIFLKMKTGYLRVKFGRV